MQKIDPERIRAHVRFLSHDLLEGRGTGQRGGDIAAEYIATQFALDGLQPAGDNGTFLQKVPMVGVTPDPATTFSLVGSSGPAKDLKPLTEYVAYNATQQPESDGDAEVVRNSNSGEKSYLKLEGAPKLKVASWIHLEAARALANMAGMDIDKIIADAQSRSFHPAPLDVRLKAHMVSKIRPFESNNVLAKLPGSDSKLKSEAVIYTAHYDHLGIRPDMPGDNIYNGANDNDTGCGILLEMARDYSQAAQAPRRSVIFASVTAEEQGLLGSEYLGKHPPVPAGGIALDLNYDDVPPLGSPEEVEVSGSERTTFYPTVEGLANEFRLTIRPDARPEAGHYYRSDHFSLARVAIPAFSINEGVKYKGHDAAWGIQQADEYTAKHYHQPSDEYHPSMDFTGDAAMARFGFALGWGAASMPKLVTWNKGDEFEPARLKSARVGE